MIVRSFFRRATTKIYVLLLVTIITVVCILNSSNISLNNQIDKIYRYTNLFIVSTKEDAYNKLKNDSRINNTRRAIALSSASLTDAMVEDDYNRNHPISWTLLTYYAINTMLAYRDESNNLKNNEIAIGLDALTYSNSSNILDKYTGKEVHVAYKEKEYTFVIKELYDAGMFSEFKIAAPTYDEFLKEEERFIYTANINREKYQDPILKEYDQLRKYDEDKIGAGNFNDEREEASYEIFEQYKIELKNLNIATYVLYIIFLLMFIIISKNILEDIATDIKLESILGYNKTNIRINVLKRIISMYATNILISIVVSIISIVILNKINNSDLIVFNYNYYIKVTLFLVILNIALLPLANNKLDVKKRRI